MTVLVIALELIIYVEGVIYVNTSYQLSMPGVCWAYAL